MGEDAPQLRLLPTAEWIVRQAIGRTRPADLVRGLCEQLNANGIAVGRMQVAFRILHPLFGAMTITWTEGGGVETELREGNRTADDEFAVSPFAAMLESGATELRVRLDDTDATARFPLLGVLAERGFSEYLALVIAFGEVAPESEAASGVVMSFATRRAAGFRDEEIDVIRWLCGPLSLALKAEIHREIAGNALRTFHGAAVGERILGGMIKRGSGERIRTVIWYSDLRNSTLLGETLPLDRFLALLNAYFDCSAGAILEHGGQVLELIGDAVLGIFPVGAGEPAGQACRSAIAAARTARARLKDLDREGSCEEAAVEFGIGLHLGEVIFGNVGTPDRLSFGLVGGAVSETARLEGLTKTLGRPVVLSDAVAAFVEEPLEDLGMHGLRGMAAPRRLWALISD